MISTVGFKGLNAVIQCGVVTEVFSTGLMSSNWNIRAPCAAFLMSFLTVCWSSKQMSVDMMSSLFPKYMVSSAFPEASMVIDHAKVLFASTQGSNPCHTTEPLVRVVPSAAALTDLFGPCSQSENTLIQCRPRLDPCSLLPIFVLVATLPLSFSYLPPPFLRITRMSRAGYAVCNQRRTELTASIAAAAAIDLKRQVGSAGENMPKSSDVRRASARA